MRPAAINREKEHHRDLEALYVNERLANKENLKRKRTRLLKDLIEKATKYCAKATDEIDFFIRLSC